MSTQRKVYYRLVTRQGLPYERTDTDFVMCSPDENLMYLVEKVHSKNSAILPWCTCSQLKVHLDSASLNIANGALEKKSALGDSHGNASAQALLVVVPNQADLLNKGLLMSEPNYYLYLAPKNQVPRAVAAYQEMAERMQQDSATEQYINALWEGFVKGTNEEAFNALCAPSGTGKTQLAFALPKEKCTCIYLNASLAADDSDMKQSVSMGFVDYMEQFIISLEEDHRSAKESRLWIFGFISALLKLLIADDSLRFPGDMSRLRLSSENNVNAQHCKIVRRVDLTQFKSDFSAWSMKNPRVGSFLQERTHR